MAHHDLLASHIPRRASTSRWKPKAAKSVVAARDSAAVVSNLPKHDGQRLQRKFILNTLTYSGVAEAEDLESHHACDGCVSNEG